MSTSRGKLIFKNVMPAILANACVFLFSVVDGIFVGQGAGSDALGAVNLALPFVLLAQALNAMASIGGVTITAIRFGRGEKEGAQNAFMHALALNLCVGVLITLLGSVFTGGVVGILSASEGYIRNVRDGFINISVSIKARGIMINGIKRIILRGINSFKSFFRFAHKNCFKLS